MTKIIITSIVTVFLMSTGYAKSEHSLASKYAQKVFRKILKERNFKIVSDESTSLKYNREDFTYSKKLTFKTKRGYFCQGEMAFEVDLDNRIEKDSLLTNLSCYSIKSRRKTLRRKG